METQSALGYSLHVSTTSLPSTVSEILTVAASVFTDPAAVSCVIQASWGMVTVYRNGEIFAGVRQ
jgi:hypothetical protein